MGYIQVEIIYLNKKFNEGHKRICMWVESGKCQYPGEEWQYTRGGNYPRLGRVDAVVSSDW